MAQGRKRKKGRSHGSVAPPRPLGADPFPSAISISATAAQLPFSPLGTTGVAMPRNQGKGGKGGQTELVFPLSFFFLRLPVLSYIFFPLKESEFSLFLL